MALDLTPLLPKRDDTYVGTMARGLVGSEILRIAAEIRELTAQGRKVCNLTVGDFSPREFPIPGLAAPGHLPPRSRAGETNYPPVGRRAGAAPEPCSASTSGRWG